MESIAVELAPGEVAIFVDHSEVSGVGIRRRCQAREERQCRHANLVKSGIDG